jgi:hypothetical protein
MAETPPPVFDTEEPPAAFLTPFEKMRPRAWGWMQPGGGS